MNKSSAENPGRENISYKFLLNVPANNAPRLLISHTHDKFDFTIPNGKYSTHIHKSFSHKVTVQIS